MSFVPENDLERALVAAAADETRRAEFYGRLFDTKVFVLGDVVPALMGGGQEMRLLAARNGARDYHLVFSSQTRLRNFANPDQPFVHILGRELFGNVQGPWFYLNPGVEYGRELPPDEVARMMASLPPPPPPATANTVTLDAPTEIKVFQPSSNPAALVEALSAAFDARADVLAAHLILIAFEGDGEEPHFMIGVETTADWEVVSDEVGRIAAGVMPDQLFDVAAIDRANKTQEGLNAALLSVPPFYTRTKLS
jgi:hypothetical protein